GGNVRARSSSAAGAFFAVCARGSDGGGYSGRACETMGCKKVYVRAPNYPSKRGCDGDSAPRQWTLGVRAPRALRAVRVGVCDGFESVGQAVWIPRKTSHGSQPL